MKLNRNEETENRELTFPFDGKYTFVDVENPNIYTDTVCAVSMIVVEDGREVLRHTELINPKTFFSAQNISVHKIRPKDVRNARTFIEFYHEYEKYFGKDYVLAGHNINSDISIINRDLSRSGEKLPSVLCLDTSDVMKSVFYDGTPAKGGLRLKNCAAALQIPLKAHEASSDVNACYEMIRLLAKNHDFELSGFVRNIPPSKIYTPTEMRRNMAERKQRKAQNRADSTPKISHSQL